MLTIYRRHRKNCKQRMEGRDYRRCLCPIWVDGSLNGVEIRKSLRLRDWQRAQDLLREWEAEGERKEKPKPLTVKEACDKFLADAEARSLREPTLYKYQLLFRQLQEFAAMHGLPHVENFDIDSVRRFRASWTNKNIAARKKLEAFRAFFRFVHESGWISRNPACHLKPPRITEPPTAPFTRDEVSNILEACDIYPDEANALRLRALVLLLRYSGLRIRDAVTLSRNRIQGDKLFLYTAKTGTAVYCPLPPFVVEALNAIPESVYFFWTGLSKPKSAVGDWQRSLKRLLILAGVPDGHAHRFRDTFSVELLLAGVPMERVSILLGHQSVRITEKHYAPWVRARQEQLEADVRRTWQTPEPKRRVHGGYTEKGARVIPFESRRKNGGGGGSRTIRACSFYVTYCKHRNARTAKPSVCPPPMYKIVYKEFEGRLTNRLLKRWAARLAFPYTGEEPESFSTATFVSSAHATGVGPARHALVPARRVSPAGLGMGSLRSKASYDKIAMTLTFQNPADYLHY